MKLFKTVDEKFEEIGFTKTQDDKYGVCYERFNSEYNYTHVIYIGHKASGKHIIQSCDKDHTNALGSLCVGLTYYENKLALKKMKQKGWCSR